MTDCSCGGAHTNVDGNGGHSLDCPARPRLRLLPGQDGFSDLLVEVADSPDPALAVEPPTREEMLEAIPLHVVIADGVNLDSADPALIEDSGRRACVAERRAGGRCTAPPATHSLLCNAHSGRLDASAGGHARARQVRERQESQEERARLARLGPRAVIAETLAANASRLQRTVEVLLTAASEGDLAAAKLVAPYINQAHGMPAQRVETHEVSDDTLGDLSSLTTEQLQQRLQAARAAAAEQREAS